MVSLLLCRLLNSEQAMEFGLEMTKLFLVFTLLVTEGFSKPVHQSTQIDQQSNSTFLTNLTQGLEKLLDMEGRFKIDQTPGKYG